MAYRYETVQVTYQIVGPYSYENRQLSFTFFVGGIGYTYSAQLTLRWYFTGAPAITSDKQADEWKRMAMGCYREVVPPRHNEEVGCFYTIYLRILNTINAHNAIAIEDGHLSDAETVDGGDD